jgi:rhamnosyltransferase
VSNKDLISVIIPVKNGLSTIRKCLDSLLAQTVAGDMEIIIVDSGSTDGTLDVLRDYPVRLFGIPPETFNHGLTRNDGVRQAAGRLIYLTVQDSWQKDDNSLEKMRQYFDDPAVAGVCGVQGIPPGPEFDPVHGHKPIDDPSVQRIHFTDQQVFEALTPQQQANVCAWDDVNAMYRKEALVKFPFPETDFAEDMAWAKAALRSGMVLVKDSGAVVYHYHYRSFNYALKINLTYHYHIYRLFHLRPSYPPVLTNIVRSAYRLTRIPAIKWPRKFQWLFHHIGAETGSWYAAFLFRMALRKKGGNKLAELYQSYCKTVPQGRLKGQDQV